MGRLECPPGPDVELAALTMQGKQNLFHEIEFCMHNSEWEFFEKK